MDWIPACPSGLLASLEGAGMTKDTGEVYGDRREFSLYERT